MSVPQQINFTEKLEKMAAKNYSKRSFRFINFNIII